MKVSFITLGCPKNLVETERLLGALVEKVEIVDPDSADIVVLKTCGFIKDAVAESKDWIERLLKSKNGRQIIVTGCLVNRFQDQLKAWYPGIDHLLTLKGEGRLPEIIGIRRPASHPRFITTFPYAYLMISDGCDNRCRYCTIPDIRGPYRSFPIEEVVAEAQALSRLGIKELILVGQDTGYYGQDLEGRSLLPELIQELLKVRGFEWLRLMYLHPAHFDPRLIELLQDSRVCNYLDIPIQHASDKILKKMGRKVRKSYLVKLFSQLKELGVALRTTAMVGFPGETDSDFLELCQFVEEIGFAHLGIFRFSPEPGTPAFSLPDRVEKQIVDERFDHLGKIGATLTDRFNRSFIGRKVKVLIDQKGRGRREFDAPGVDSVVKVEGRIGELVEVEITSGDGYRLVGKRC